MALIQLLECGFALSCFGTSAKEEGSPLKGRDTCRSNRALEDSRCYADGTPPGIWTPDTAQYFLSLCGYGIDFDSLYDSSL